MNEIQITHLDKETKRFLAATQVLAALMATEIPIDMVPNASNAFKLAAKTAVNFADALIVALDEKK